MMTLRRALRVWGPLALSFSVLQCDDSYTANEFTPPDLGSAGRFDFASAGGAADLATGTGDMTTPTFPAPQIVTIAPALGPNGGNTALTITGTGFQSGATVKIAGVACNNVSVVSATSITCTTAGKAATCGAAAVVVTNPDLQAATSTKFAYQSKAFALSTGKNIPNGANSRSAVWADFNGDGKNDLANLNATTATTINVQLGNGDGTFADSKVTTLGAGQVPSALAVGDLDNNGAPDLVVILNGTAAAPQVLVLLGQKDGTFKPQAGGPVALTKSSAPTAVVVATADSQAKPYVVVSGTVAGFGTIDVLQNDGTGLLGTLTTKVVGGTGANHLVLADLNGDDKLDAITANSAGNSVSVLAGDGAGNFTPVAGSPFAMGNAPNHVLAVDLDNDAKLDLVTANTGGFLNAGLGLNVRKGDGMGGFGAVVFTSLSTAPNNLTAADFNLDGNADIAVSHTSAQFTYLTGKGAIGTAPFNNAVTVTVGAQASSILAAPFHTNSDSLYDVVTTSSSTNNLSISLNVCQ